VDFYDGGSQGDWLGSATLTNGTATFATSNLSAGDYTITATYREGDGNYAGSTSAGLAQTVLVNNTNTNLTSSLNPSTQNQAVTFTANVTPSGTVVNAPRTGTVDFYDGINPSVKIGSGTVSNGVATLTTSGLGAGDHIITAWYEGDGTYNGSTSQGLTQTVNSGGSSPVHSPSTKVSTRTGITASRRSAPVGTPVTFTATIASASASTHTPTGTVQFWEVDPVTGANIRLLSTTSVDATGHATLTISSLSRGVHRIKAVYLGDTNFVGSFGLYDETIM
jgi:hypothetical protein